MSDTPVTAPETYVPPPGEIAGADALRAEPTGEETGDERPFVEVRGERFHVRAGIPALLPEKLAMVQRDLPKVAPGTEWADLTPQAQARFQAVRAVSYELLMATIVADERYAFEEFVINAEPVVEATELAQVMRRALQAASGRPTEPS